MSVAFPAISTGVDGYPIEPAARITVTMVRSAPTAFGAIRFVCFDTTTRRADEDALADLR